MPLHLNTCVFEKTYRRPQAAMLEVKKKKGGVFYLILLEAARLVSSEASFSGL